MKKALPALVFSLCLNLHSWAQEATSTPITKARINMARTMYKSAQEADEALKRAVATQQAVDQVLHLQKGSGTLEPRAMKAVVEAIAAAKESLATAVYGATANQAAANFLGAVTLDASDLNGFKDSQRKEAAKTLRNQQHVAARNAMAEATATITKFTASAALFSTAESSVNAAATEVNPDALNGKLVTASTDLKAAVNSIQDATLSAHAVGAVARAIAGNLLEEDQTEGILRESVNAGRIFLGNRSVRLAVGLGASYDLNRTYNYTLAAPDYRLAMDKQGQLNGVASAVLAYSPTYYYKALDSNGEATGPSYVVRSKYSGLASVNLLDLNKEFGFTRRLNLGLGVGYLFGDSRNEANSVILGFFAEVTYERFLYDYYAAMAGKPLPAFGSTTPTPSVLNSLDLSNDNFFRLKAVYSVGLKLVYLINGKNAPAEQVTQKLTKQTQE